MRETSEPVRFDDKQASAADVRDAVQLSSLADPRSAMNSPPARPDVFLILAANKALEVNPPNHVVRLHEIEG